MDDRGEPEDVFAAPEMVAGYARSRPPVHPRILARVWERLGPEYRAGRALDLGCGAGVSTVPLLAHASFCLGVDPVEAMVHGGAVVAPGARFAARLAEHLPVRTGSIDLVTAAGSLNYTDLALGFPEVKRVLHADGALVVYDFSMGRSLRDSDALDAWFVDFSARYPRAPGSAHSLDPESLAAAATGFRMVGSELVEVALALELASYCDYVMTETNVAQAISRGDDPETIRAWCVASLADVFADVAREVVFRGYLAHLVPSP